MVFKTTGFQIMFRKHENKYGNDFECENFLILWCTHQPSKNICPAIARFFFIPTMATAKLPPLSPDSPLHHRPKTQSFFTNAPNASISSNRHFPIHYFHKPIQISATFSIPKQRTTNPNDQLISFCQTGDLEMALKSISSIDSLDSDSCCLLLQLCADINSLKYGKRVHSAISDLGIELNTSLGAKLVYMYVKCGDLRGGRRVFDEMLCKDHTYTWNLLMSEYSKTGDYDECLRLYTRMWSLGVMPDSRTFSCILKCLWANGNLKNGEIVHGCITKLGFGACVVVNSLISFYSKCSRIESAMNLFDEMLDKDVISWNSIINGCLFNNLSMKAIELFLSMCSLGINFDSATLVSVLPACADMGSLKLGQTLHGYSIKVYSNKKVTLLNSLIDMYWKCGNLDSSKRLFDAMEDRSIVSWTSMISGYAHSGMFKEAIKLFELMESEGVKPGIYTVSSILHACACNGSIEQGKRIHLFVTTNGLEHNISIANALMDMYAKCGNMEAARNVFDKTTKKDIFSWNTMIGGYSKNCFPSEALNLFINMQSHIRPDSVTMSCVLPCIVSFCSIKKGKEVHAFVVKSHSLLDTYVSNALLDMYAKCGSLLLARRLFDQTVKKDLISWTIMIAAYGMNGQGKEAMEAFKEMKSVGIVPSPSSFISLLYSCSHSGLVDEGWRYFNIMQHEYKIEPTLEHYTCMVDLLSRAGLLKKAYKLITSMPVKQDSSIWGVLLSGCKIHKDVKLAEKIVDHLVELEPENTSNFVLLANLYEELEKQEPNRKRKIKKFPAVHG